MDVDNFDTLPRERLVALVLTPGRLDGIAQELSRELLAKTAQIRASGLSATRSSVLRSQWPRTSVLPLPATPRTRRGLPSISEAAEPLLVVAEDRPHRLALRDLMPSRDGSAAIAAGAEYSEVASTSTRTSDPVRVRIIGWRSFSERLQEWGLHLGPAGDQDHELPRRGSGRRSRAGATPRSASSCCWRSPCRRPRCRLPPPAGCGRSRPSRR